MENMKRIQDERYVAVQPLATGGAASVWSAVDRQIGRRVVLKVAHEAEPRGWGHSLWREYEALVRLRSPQLSIVRDRGRSRNGPLPANRPYLVLDRIRAHPLGTRRRSIGSLTRLAEGLGRALADIHDRGWLHRDIKPSNVLWDSKRRQPPVLIDLGLAVPIGHRPTAGKICGSLPYVAPEAIFGERLDERTDLYAFGQLLWRAWTGRPPRRETTADGWLRWHVVGNNPDAGRARSGLPAVWQWTIRRLVERDPLKRPANIREALRPLGLAPPPPRALPPSDWRKLRLRLDRAAAGFPSVLWTPDCEWPDGLDAREWLLWAAGREMPTLTLSANCVLPDERLRQALAQLDTGGLMIHAHTDSLACSASRRRMMPLVRRLVRAKTCGLMLLYGPRPERLPELLESVLQNLRETEPGPGNAAEAR